MEFRLGGKDYVLSKEEVEDSLKHVAPEDVRKHYVSVNDRRYPVKQALAAAIGRPLTDFITTDAIRILSNLGFEVGNIKEPKPQVKNTSEILFEEYLRSNGLGYFQFHKQIPGFSRPPDYVLSFEGREILFELKEFHATPEDFRLGSGSYDPYGPIREKIEAGRKKFRDVTGRCCCLVLYNCEKPLVSLGWQFIYGAMLGNMAIRMPFDPDRGLRSDPAEFGPHGGGGKMIRYDKGEPPKPLEPQNSKISAILVLQQMGVGKRRFDIAVKLRQQELGRRLTWEEHFEAVDKSRGTEQDVSLTQLRVVVCENPYAQIPLPREIFHGPYDEAYGLDETTNDRISRLCAGEQIKQLESQGGSAQSPMRRIIEENRRRQELATNDEATG